MSSCSSVIEPGPASLTAVVGSRGPWAELRCLEITSEGLTVLVPSGVSSSELQPGHWVQLFELRRDGVVLLENQRCQVDHARAAEDGALAVSLGFERLSRSFTALRIGNTQRIRAVICAGRDFSCGTDDGFVAQRFAHAQLGAHTLKLIGPALPVCREWSPGRPVTLRFEHEGRSLQGYARLVQAGELQWEVAVPPVLIELPARGGLNTSAERLDAALAFVSPLSGRAQRRGVLELSTQGARFPSEGDEALPPGLRLVVVLELGAVQLALASVVERVGEGECTLRFVSLDDPSRFVLIDFLAPHRVAGAACASRLPFEGVSSMFRSEGVAPPRPPPPAPGLSKSFVLLREGEPVGHVSGLRTYARTWLAQHLLMKAGVHDAATRSQQLMTLSLEVGEAMSDVEYVRALWRMSSRNAAHIQGASSPRLLRPGLVYRTVFDPMRAPLGRVPDPGPLFVREAGPSDEPAFLSFVSATEEPVKLLSDDLVAGEVHLETLSKRFGAAGLSRSRALTIVEDDDGTPLGWALLQTMSAGLAWAELHNSFRLFVPAAAGARAPEVRRSLIAHAARFFAAMGRGEAVCKAGPADLPELTSLGFVSQGAVCEFGAHRSALPDFTRQLISALTRLPQRETKRRAHRGG